MTLATHLKKKGVKLNQGPVWLGPYSNEWNGGLTYSMLVAFMNCRERFRVKYCLGLRSKPTFQHRMEYGNLWHVCEENYAAGKDWEKPLKTYAQQLCQEYRLEQQVIQHWYNVCRVTYPHYIEHWSKHKDVKNRNHVVSEFVFDLPYELPSGRSIRLRGKIDSIDTIGKKVWLQENKARGDIEELQTSSQMRDDLQSMMYAAVLARYLFQQLVVLIDKGKLNFGSLGTFGGIRYNVARRPLSGGKDSIRQKQGESEGEFYERLSGLIADHPDHYFARWNVEFQPSDLHKWEQRTLIPLLEQVCDWWEVMEEYNFDPFNHPNYYSNDGSRRGLASNHGIHWQYPHGTYNTLQEGGHTELDEYLSNGNMTGLHRVKELFNELR